MNKIAQKTIADEITTITQYEINRIPQATKCTITKIYDDNIHADIETNNSTIKYVETISNNLTIGNTGILIFLDGNENDYVVITK